MPMFAVVLRWTVLCFVFVVYTTKEDWPEAMKVYALEYSRLLNTSQIEKNDTIGATNSKQDNYVDDEVDESVAADFEVAKVMHEEIREVHEGMSKATKRLIKIHEENQELWTDLTVEVALLDALIKGHIWLASHVDKENILLHDTSDSNYQETGDWALAIEEEIRKGVQLSALVASTRAKVAAVNETEAKRLRSQRELKQKDVKRLELAVPREEHALQLRVARNSWANAERQPGTTVQGRLNGTALRYALSLHLKKVWIHSGWETVRIQLLADWRTYLHKRYLYWKRRRASDWQWHRTHTPIIIEVERRFHKFNRTCFDRNIHLNAVLIAAALAADQCSQLASELAVCFSALWTEIDQFFDLNALAKAAGMRLWHFLQSIFGYFSIWTQCIFMYICTKIQESSYAPPLLRRHASLLICIFLSSPMLLLLARAVLLLPRRILRAYFSDLAWLGRTFYLILRIILWRLPCSIYRRGAVLLQSLRLLQ